MTDEVSKEEEHTKSYAVLNQQQEVTTDPSQLKAHKINGLDPPDHDARQLSIAA